MSVRGSACLLTACLAASAFASPDAGLKAVQAAALQLDRAVTVQGLRVNIGPAALEIEAGVLVPVSSDGAPVAEMVFLGQAWLVIDPPDEIEAGQIELFTGRRRVRAKVSEATLAVALDEATEALLGGEVTTLDATTSTKARTAWADWRSGPERKLLGVEGALWLHALGDPVMEDFFAGRFVTERHGPLLLSVDPEAGEQVTLGRFVPLELDARDTRRQRKRLHRQQRRGRLLGIELDGLGTFDTWMSTPLIGPGGFAYRGVPAFAAMKYELDVELSGRDETLSGRGKILLRPMTGSRRGVALRLHSDLRILSLKDGDGVELPYLREGSSLLAVLPTAPAIGETVVLDVAWEGKGLERLERGLFRLVDTVGWHPRAGGADERARYDVTIGWPQGLDLVGSGRIVEEGPASDGRRRQRRVLDLPSVGFSFELGRFDIERFRVGEVDVTLAFDKESKKESKKTRAAIVWAVKDAFTWYSKVLGPYPLDQLVVVTVPRDFSQGLPGFVTLSSGPVTFPKDWQSFYGIEDAGTIVAHELAHQWWGNRVGFQSYRDEWLSEGMSSWLALAWSDRIPWEERSGVGPSGNWRNRLNGRIREGRPIESLGPIVLGRRLDSSLAPRAYDAIVYDKGAIVLNGLAASLGQDVFLQSLAAIGGAAEGKLMNTGSFFRSLEKTTGRELDDFVTTWVEGTGMPQVWYATEMRRADEGAGWVARATITQRPTYLWRHRVERVPGSGWDLKSRAEPRLDVSRSILTVPFGLSMNDPARGGKKDVDGANAVMKGRITLDRVEQVIEIPLQAEPKKLTLDPQRRSFGSFYRIGTATGSGAITQAWDAIAEQRLDDAERIVREREGLVNGEALGKASHGLLRRFEIMDRVVQSMLLAEIQLAGGRVEEAEASLKDAASAPVGQVPRSLVRERELLEARVAVIRGDGRRALRILKDRLSGKKPWLSGKAWAITALAARLTGDAALLERARGKAEERGVDMSALDSD